MTTDFFFIALWFSSARCLQHTVESLLLSDTEARQRDALSERDVDEVRERKAIGRRSIAHHLLGVLLLTLTLLSIGAATTTLHTIELR